MSEIKVGDRVRTGVYVLGEWRPMWLGDVVAVSTDGTLANVDVMSLHGGCPRIHLEQISHLRKEPSDIESSTTEALDPADCLAAYETQRKEMTK